jgi:GAF domain-containing protein
LAAKTIQQQGIFILVDMRSSSSPDPDDFQKVLADAFVVQESEIETRSLCAVVELQGMIATGELDVDRAMTLIADRARDVANATGIAIALLRGDQLTYRAGTGSSVDRVGRNVTAVLSVSRQIQSRDEILRVENAHADRRIEAAICRQFGARSLLILPIYDHRALVGVLEVIFSNAHEFQDREVRTYRLMASLVGDAMSRAEELRQKKAAAKHAAIDQHIEQAAPQLPVFPYDVGPKSEPISHPASRQARIGHALADKFPTRTQLVRIGSIIGQRAKNAPLYKRCTVAVVLALVSWIAYRDYRPVSARGDSALQESNKIAQPASVSSGNSSLSVESKQPATPVSTEVVRTTAATTPRWVRVNSNELDYVAEDVTVRHFTPIPARPPVQVGHSHVKTIGDDVTVRYFSSAQPTPRVQPGSTQIHYISEGATVPPVRRKYVAMPGPPGDSATP